MEIGIINYGLSNMGSVYSAFRFYNSNVKLINGPGELDKTDVIVLAGVGNFKVAVSRLKQKGFWSDLNYQVKNKKKLILGICLGMQLFADVSYEDGRSYGFGWIKGEVIKMDNHYFRVPHIGWDEVKFRNTSLFSGMRYNFFYFMHSYHFRPNDKKVIIGVTGNKDFEIVSAVRKNNIVGVQFHPEKSQGDGLRFLKNFLRKVS
jgi:glutamine amidotransferase